LKKKEAKLKKKEAKMKKKEAKMKKDKAPKIGSKQKNIMTKTGFHSHPVTKSFDLKWKTVMLTINWSVTRMFGLGGVYGVRGVCLEWRDLWPGYAVLQKSVKGLKQVILAASDDSIGSLEFAEPLSLTFLKYYTSHASKDDHVVLLNEILPKMT